MRKTFTIALTLALLTPFTARAQMGPELPVPSPAAQVMQRVGLTDITVEYSSPGRKKRRVYGGLVPYGELWRTGANRATTIEFSRDVTFGGKAIPAGKYAIFSIPTRNRGWTVILNKNPDQGGTSQYDEALNIAEVKVKPALITPRRERMTFLFSETTDESTRLDLEWERLRVSVPITVDTKTQVAANIEKATGETWLPDVRTAAYLLETGKTEAALSHVQKSVTIKSHWYNNWVHAQVLEKMGKKDEAKAAAETSLSLGDDSGAFNFYKPQIEAVAGVAKK